MLHREAIAAVVALVAGVDTAECAAIAPDGKAGVDLSTSDGVEGTAAG